MDQNQIESLDAHSFANKKWPHLEEITLKSNRLTHINAAIFANSQAQNWLKLTSLDLSHNDIAFVDANAFQHLINLTELNLSHNRMGLLQATLCQGLSKLKKILNTFLKAQISIFYFFELSGIKKNIFTCFKSIFCFDFFIFLIKKS